MLNTGLIVHSLDNRFNSGLLADLLNHQPDLEMKPNQRLLDQFAAYLADLDIPHVRQTLHLKPSRQRVVIWELEKKNRISKCRVILSSTPMAGKSYLKAVMLDSRSDSQLSVDFVAQSPSMAFIKLQALGFIQEGGHNV